MVEEDVEAVTMTIETGTKDSLNISLQNGLVSIEVVSQRSRDGGRYTLHDARFNANEARALAYHLLALADKMEEQV